jgi:hypothetical protein
MKVYFKILTFSIFVLSGIYLIITGCTEHQKLDSIFDANSVNQADSVVITAVVPEVAGSASEIVLQGRGFNPQIENNWVYFIGHDLVGVDKYEVNSIQATIKSVTENELVVFRPRITSDSIIIKVISSEKMVVGQYHKNYPMESIFDDFGVLLPTAKVTNLCIDKDDNAYLLLLTSSEIYKLTPAGKEDTTFLSTTGSSVEFALDIKEGPGGFIYFLRKSGSRTSIYRFPKTGGEPERFHRVSFLAETFDYDQNGNMYLGGRDGLMVLKPDLTEIGYDMYNDYLINTVRVFDNSVYILATYAGTDSLNNPSGIFKNEILSNDGQLNTTNNLVLDWSAAGEYSESFFNSMTISEDGNIYVATDYTDPILSLSPTGEVSKLYYGYLNTEVNHLMWGGGNYLYVLTDVGVTFAEGNKVIRINMGKKGAPYYGRDL